MNKVNSNKLSSLGYSRFFYHYKGLTCLNFVSPVRTDHERTELNLKFQLVQQLRLHARKVFQKILVEKRGLEKE